jgi:hypothetical protein
MSDKTTMVICETMAAIVDAAPASPELPIVRERRTRRDPVVVAAVAFAAAASLLLVMVGGPALLKRAPNDVGSGEPITTLAPSGTENPVTTQAIATTAPVPTTDPTASLPVVPVVSWQRGESIGSGEAGMLVVGGPGYVRAGSICGTVDAVVCGTQTPAVWVSTDAVTWDRVGEDDFAGVSGGISGVATSPAGFVAVGVTGDAFSRGAVWVSPDGVAWTQVPDDDGVFAGEGHAVIESMTRGGPGYVAVGWENPTGSNTNAVVWTSVDGMLWDRVVDPDLLGGPAAQAADMTGVVAGGSGLVAYGSGVWLSPDGSDWSRVEGFAFDLVTADPDSGALVGFTDGEVWTSVDGASWAQLGPLPQPNAVGAAAWKDQVVVAVGGDESGVVWMSPDAGRTWITSDDGGFAAAEGRVTSFGDVLFDGSRFILSGSDCDQTAADCHGIIWTSD